MHPHRVHTAKQGLISPTRCFFYHGRLRCVGNHSQQAAVTSTFSSQHGQAGPSHLLAGAQQKDAVGSRSTLLESPPTPSSSSGSGGSSSGSSDAPAGAAEHQQSLESGSVSTDASSSSNSGSSHTMDASSSEEHGTSSSICSSVQCPPTGTRRRRRLAQELAFRFLRSRSAGELAYRWKRTPPDDINAIHVAAACQLLKVNYLQQQAQEQQEQLVQGKVPQGSDQGWTREKCCKLLYYMLDHHVLRPGSNTSSSSGAGSGSGGTSTSSTTGSSGGNDGGGISSGSGGSSSPDTGGGSSGGGVDTSSSTSGGYEANSSSSSSRRPVRLNARELASVVHAAAVVGLQLEEGELLRLSQQAAHAAQGAAAAAASTAKTGPRDAAVAALGASAQANAMLLWALHRLWQQQTLGQREEWVHWLVKQQQQQQGMRWRHHHHHHQQQQQQLQLQDEQTKQQQQQPAGQEGAPPARGLWLGQFLGVTWYTWATYPCRSLAILVLALARLQPQLRPEQANALVAAVQQQLPCAPSSDLAMLVWGLSVLQLPLPEALLVAWCRVGSARLSFFSTKDLSAACVALARLRYRPSPRFLRGLFDQLYWTADQFDLVQVASILWALGRLKVAVPEEVSQRLAVFAGLQLLAASYPTSHSQSPGSPSLGHPPAAVSSSSSSSFTSNTSTSPSDSSSAAANMDADQLAALQQSPAWAAALAAMGEEVQLPGVEQQQQQHTQNPQQQHPQKQQQQQQQQQEGGRFVPHPQELAMVLSGVASGSWRPPAPWLATMTDLVVATLPRGSLQALCMCCRGLGKLKAPLTQQQKASILQEATRRLGGPQGTPGGGGTPVRARPVQGGGAGSSSGAQQLQAGSSSAMQQLQGVAGSSSAVQQLQGGAGSSSAVQQLQDVAYTLPPLLLLGMRLPKELVDAWLAPLAACLPAASAHGIQVHTMSVLLNCCGQMRWVPLEGWWASLEEWLAAAAGCLSGQELLGVMAALLAWQQAPALGPRVVAALESRVGQLRAAKEVSVEDLEQLRSRLRVLVAQAGMACNGSAHSP